MKYDSQMIFTLSYLSYDTFGIVFGYIRRKRIPDKINIARDFIKQFRSN